MRGTSKATWALAASTVPAATRTGGLRNVLTTEAASKDAMAFEQFGDRRLAQTARRVRRRRGFPEFEQPFGAEVVLEFEQGREVAPELLAQAVDEAVPFDAEILGDARPFAQLDDDRVGGRERAEATRIGAQGGGHDLGVAAVVLSAGHGETVAEAVHLLRVDGVDLEAALDQRLDYRAVRDFDRGQD